MEQPYTVTSASSHDIPRTISENYPGNWYSYDIQRNDPWKSCLIGCLFGYIHWMTDGTWYLTCIVTLCGIISTFIILRSIPNLSYDALIQSERRILSHIITPLLFDWSIYTTKSAKWCIHSVRTTYPSKRNGEVAHPCTRCPGRACYCATKPDIIIVHGHSAAHGHWEPIIDSLARFANLHMLDLPGWGRSPLPPQLAECQDIDKITDMHVECLHGWMEVHNIRRAFVMGHSIGGFLCANLARKYPESIEKLILVDPCGVVSNMTTSHLWTLGMAYMTPQRLARTFGRALYLIFRSLGLANTVEHIAFADYYYQLAAATQYTGCSDTLFGKFVHHKRYFTRGYWARPIVDIIARIEIPMAVLWGSHDEMFPSQLTTVIGHAQPRATVHILAGCLHNPAHNDAKAFTEAVRSEIMASAAPGGERQIPYHSIGKQNARLPSLHHKPSKGWGPFAAPASPEIVTQQSPEDLSVPTLTYELSSMTESSSSSESIPESPLLPDNTPRNRLRYRSHTIHLDPASSSMQHFVKKRASIPSQTEKQNHHVAHKNHTPKEKKTNDLPNISSTDSTGTKVDSTTSSDGINVCHSSCGQDKPKDHITVRTSNAPQKDPSRFTSSSQHMASCRISRSFSAGPACRPSYDLEHGWGEQSARWGPLRFVSGRSVYGRDTHTTKRFYQYKHNPVKSDMNRSTDQYKSSHENRQSSYQSPSSLELSYSMARGVCIGCGHRVQLVENFWRCGCGAWTFYHHLRAQNSVDEFERMMAFLCELYSPRPFAAKRCAHIAPHNWIDTSSLGRYQPDVPTLRGLL